MLIILSNKEKGALIMLILPIKKWSRKHGYISWTRTHNEKMKGLLKQASKVHIFFQDFNLGWKNVDWKYHRISIGSMWTKKLPTNLCEYVLNYEDKNILKVKCR